MALSENVDSTYADKASDPSVKQHQQDHDSLHEAYNAAVDAEVYDEGTGTWNGASPVTEADTVTVTNGHIQSVGAGSYATVLDITSGGAELLSGSLHGERTGFRLTIDGTVVINDTGNAAGRDAADNAYQVVSLPWAKADSTLKLEVYNGTIAAGDYGWKILTR